MQAFIIYFIAVIFAAFFVIDLKTGVGLRPTQYGLLALALTLLYVLLRSVVRTMPFETAYYTVTSVVTVLLCVYLYAVTRRRFVAPLMAMLLAAQYGFLVAL